MKRMLGLVGSLLLAWSAHSQTYTYQGSPIGGITLSGSFSIDTPLLANGVQTLSPTDWSFIGNFQSPADAMLNMTTANLLDSLHNGGGNFSFATFTVTTQNNSISAWDFELYAALGQTFNVVTESITSSGDSYHNNTCDHVGNCTLLTGSNTTAGVLHSTNAPEIDPASASSALTLLLGGIAVIRSRKSHACQTESFRLLTRATIASHGRNHQCFSDSSTLINASHAPS